VSGAHLHLLVSHVPVVGAFFVWALLVAAAWRGDRSLWQAGIVGAVLMALAGSLAMTSGPIAQEQVRRSLDEAGLEYARTHEVAGQIATAVLALVGVLGIQAWLTMGPRGPHARWIVAGMLVGAAVAAGMAAWAGAAGGRIRHVEARGAGPVEAPFTHSPLDSTAVDRAGSR
jgi:hypothetical protein